MIKTSHKAQALFFQVSLYKIFTELQQDGVNKAKDIKDTESQEYKVNN